SRVGASSTWPATPPESCATRPAATLDASPRPTGRASAPSSRPRRRGTAPAGTASPRPRRRHDESARTGNTASGGRLHRHGAEGLAGAVCPPGLRGSVPGARPAVHGGLRHWRPWGRGSGRGTVPGEGADTAPGRGPTLVAGLVPAAGDDEGVQHGQSRKAVAVEGEPEAGGRAHSAAVVLHFQIGGGADPGPVVAHGRDESGGGGGPSRIGPLGGAEEVGPARVEAGGGPPGRGEEFRDRPRTCRGGAFP